MSRPHVVVIGCGFAGIEAVRVLSKAEVEITLVDRTNHHLFQPLLYQVATAGLSAPAVSAPIRHVLRPEMRRGNLTILKGEVEDVDVAAKTVRLDGGEPLVYDHLIVAAGATHSYFGHDEWARHAPGLKTLADAFEIRSRMIGAFESAERSQSDAERDAWLTFAVIGAGPTGVEMAGTLAEIARHTLNHEFRRIDPATARVLMLEGSPRVLQAFAPALSAKAQQQLEGLGVQVRCATQVVDIDIDGVEVETATGRQRIAARTVIWAAGVAASPLGRCLDVPLDRAGRVIVDAGLHIPGHAEVYVIGDLAAAQSHQPDGSVKPAPGVSPAAKQMGRLAAANILAHLQGKPPQKFRYRDYGSLATIGRKAAVAEVGRLQFSGYFAWLFWLFVHVYFLIGFRNRLVVLMDWAWAYFSFQRQARVIAEQAPHAMRPPAQPIGVKSATSEPSGQRI